MTSRALGGCRSRWILAAADRNHLSRVPTAGGLEVIARTAAEKHLGCACCQPVRAACPAGACGHCCTCPVATCLPRQRSAKSKRSCQQPETTSAHGDGRWRDGGGAGHLARLRPSAGQANALSYRGSCGAVPGTTPGAAEYWRRRWASSAGVARLRRPTNWERCTGSAVICTRPRRVTGGL